MATLKLRVNGKEHTVEDVDPATPLLWVLRDSLGLVGTKFGCGMAVCGACTVLVDGAPIRACSTPADSVVGKDITTIEGLAPSEKSCTHCSKPGSITTFPNVVMPGRPAHVGLGAAGAHTESHG